MRKQDIVNRRHILDVAQDHLIKATPGITGWFRPSVLSDGGVRHLDVGSTYPGGEEAAKGLAVRQLKSYVSWVQTVDALKRIAIRIYKCVRMIRINSAHEQFEPTSSRKLSKFFVFELRMRDRESIIITAAPPTAGGRPLIYVKT